MSDFTLGSHPLLKKVMIDARIRDLTEKRFIADSLLAKTTADALAIKYFKDGGADANGLYDYEEVPEVGEGSGFKRIGLSEEAKLAMIRKYGLEFAFTYEMQKWGSNAYFEKAFKKLSSSVVAMVDKMVYDRLHAAATAGNQNLQAKSGNRWNDPATGSDNLINDLVDAKAKAKEAHYSLDTVIVSPATEAILLKSKAVRDAFKQNGTDIVLLRGYLADFLGLSIIVDENYPNNQALLVERGMAGEIADAEPLTSDVYNQDEDKTTIGRVTRYTEAYITDPRAVFLITGITA
ncbi:hypothetical protein [Bacillus thuringiensis]|uniref:phage major capsid protein n=1 Tax=Bacillus thuringiensis TaxID=1428 RepID=UPI000BFBF7C8|nr:hypothetical protein [Bacillus thuringiensis]PGM47410.1 hypothetical protein CN937_03825 [Bacillus thuringiensis]